jgi:hypothetical protein
MVSPHRLRPRRNCWPQPNHRSDLSVYSIYKETHSSGGISRDQVLAAADESGLVCALHEHVYEEHGDGGHFTLMGSGIFQPPFRSSSYYPAGPATMRLQPEG